MSGRRFSKEIWIEIEQKLAEGVSKAQITRDYGISRHSIWIHEKKKLAKIEETKKKSFWDKILGR
jgi:DNA invertase Pin-like site-specific DNA recombinase